jgi:hypothetical protein
VSDERQRRRLEKAQASVAAALARLDAELERWRDGEGVVGNPCLLNAFRLRLVDMGRLLGSGDLPHVDNRHLGMGRAVSDSFPHSSELAALLIQAERDLQAA